MCIIVSDCCKMQAESRGQHHTVTTIQLLCHLLDLHASQAKKDLVNASMNAPIYGLLQSIRSAIEHGSSQPDSRDFKLDMARVAHGMVERCKELSVIVSPVVCSSSPEGFFPDSKTSCTGNSCPIEGDACMGNAQSLLLCCWHTMKEISLLLGLLMENFSEPLDNVPPVLTKDQVA